MTQTVAPVAESDVIDGVNRTDLASTVAVGFQLDVPVPHHEKLGSSVTVREDGRVQDFELRLGLVSKDRYDAVELKELMRTLLTEMDLNLGRQGAETLTHAQPAVAYDPQWGAAGFYQVHLRQGFWMPEWSEPEFFAFAHDYTERFVDAIEWVDPDDNPGGNTDD